MASFRILEVVSGLGMGGAEKALISRLDYTPAGIQESILNVRPEIDALTIQTKTKITRISSRGILRFLKMRRFLNATSYDVVIVRTPLDAVRVGLIKRTLGVNPPKLVFEAHSNFISKRFGSNFFLSLGLRILSKQINLVIAVSESVKRGPLCKSLGNVHVVYLGSQLKTGSLELVDAKSPKLLFVGRLVEIKRPIWMLERFASVATRIELPKGSLTIVGSGNLEEDARKFVESRGLGEIVNVVGFQSDLLPFYKSATHLISASTTEGLPITFFEAKLSGLAILATPSGGGSEIFSDEDHELNGFNELEFEQALQRIFSSPTPDLQARKRIRDRSQWMSAQNGSEHFYSLIETLAPKPNQ